MRKKKREREREEDYETDVQSCHFMRGEKGLEEVKKEGFLREPYGILMREGGFKEGTLQLKIGFVLVGKTWVRLSDCGLEMKEIAAEHISAKFFCCRKQNFNRNK